MSAHGKKPHSPHHQWSMGTTSVEERTRRNLHRWRRGQLAKHGFPLPLAVRISKDGHYDLHAIIGLVERGCPPELAIRILAPLDVETKESAA